MKTSISRLTLVLLTAFMSVITVSAQKGTISAAASDKYVISAKAGGVNFVEGTVGVVRRHGKSGYLLKGDRLDIGDRVSTGTEGKAEILLNPGSYLRLGGNSAFEFKTTSLDDLELKLDSGSAMLEVFAAEDFRVTIYAPKAKFGLIESGIYRIDVAADGGGTVAVWKGKAQIGDSEELLVKGGREGIVSGPLQASITKFDRDDKGALEIWSKGRAKELSKLSSSLARNNMRTSLMRSFLGNRWNIYDSFGLWVYDPFRGSHCFLPFGYGWSSPYGYGFGRSLWYYNLPSAAYTPRNSSNGPSEPTKSRVRLSPRDWSQPPPFVKMQSEGKTGRYSGASDSPSYDSPTRSSPGFSSPAPSSAPVKIDSRRPH